MKKKNALRSKIKNLKPITKQKVALLLADEGKPFNEDIAERVEGYLQDYPNASLFVISIIESFIWAEYVKRHKTTFDLAVGYFTNNDNAILNELDKILWRYEESHFTPLLKSWKLILEKANLKKLPDKFNAHNLYEFQRYVHQQVVSPLYHSKQIQRISAWTFLAPFKIMAAYRIDLWKDNKLDDVLMPLGSQVIKGLQLLHKQGVPIQSYEFIYEEERGLETDMGTTTMVQDFEKTLASSADSRVLHINSGLFLLGGGSEE